MAASDKKTETGKIMSKRVSQTKPPFFVSVSIALLSLSAGILTPPLVSYFDISHPLGGENAIQRWISQFSTPQPHPCSEEALSHFLHEESVAGMHVICAEKSSDNNSLKLILFAGAKETTAPQEVTSNNSWAGIRDALESNLHLKPQDELHQPWAIFSSVGERLVDEDTSDDRPDVRDTLVSSGLVLLFEGGQWLWPGVRVGFMRSVELYSIMPGNSNLSLSEKRRTVVLETLSLKPLVLSVEGFLSPFECDHVRTVAEPMMEYSPVVLMDKDRGKEASEWRTSQTAFVAGQDEVFVDLEHRTASLTRIPVNHQEHLQVLRYGVNEHYAAHTDYFDPAYYREDPDTLELIQNGRRQRLATVFWYLSNVEDGGETAFPYAVGHETEDECEDGLRVKPQRGKVIIFYSLTAGGEMDILSTHAACPVKAGLKNAANKWVWNGAFSEDEM